MIFMFFIDKPLWKISYNLSPKSFFQISLTPEKVCHTRIVYFSTLFKVLM